MEKIDLGEIIYNTILATAFKLRVPDWIREDVVSEACYFCLTTIKRKTFRDDKQRTSYISASARDLVNRGLRCQIHLTERHGVYGMLEGSEL